MTDFANFLLVLLKAFTPPQPERGKAFRVCEAALNAEGIAKIGIEHRSDLMKWPMRSIMTLRCIIGDSDGTVRFIGYCAERRRSLRIISDHITGFFDVDSGVPLGPTG